MDPVANEPGVSLTEFLRARARATAPARLTIDVLGGAAVAGAAAWARPRGWAILVCASACFALYGTWAVAERQLQADAPGRRPSVEFLWFAARALSAGLGAVACLLLLFLLLGVSLGTWIS